MSGDRNGKIRERAYLLWEQAGRPDGQDQEFWLRAERDTAAEGKPAPRRIKAGGIAGEAPARKPSAAQAAGTATKARARSGANGKAVTVEA